MNIKFRLKFVPGVKKKIYEVYSYGEMVSLIETLLNKPGKPPGTLGKIRTNSRSSYDYEKGWTASSFYLYDDTGHIGTVNRQFSKFIHQIYLGDYGITKIEMTKKSHNSTRGETKILVNKFKADNILFQFEVNYGNHTASMEYTDTKEHSFGIGFAVGGFKQQCVIPRGYASRNYAIEFNDIGHKSEMTKYLGMVKFHHKDKDKLDEFVAMFYKSFLMSADATTLRKE